MHIKLLDAIKSLIVPRLYLFNHFTAIKFMHFHCVYKIRDFASNDELEDDGKV